MANDTLTLGAVAYDPKVVTIWDGFQQWFRARGLDFDYVLYSNYERQVEGHFRGEYDVAWNSPLAWLQAERVAKNLGRTARAIAMRDTDQDLRSVVLVRSDSSLHKLRDLRGRVVGFGAADSPQATLIPIETLTAAGLMPEVDYTARRFDLLVGKHGDHIGGEREAARALMAGEVDAACVIDGNHLGFAREGVFASSAVRVLTETEPYDHCNFTAIDDSPAIDRFASLLLGQRYDDPAVRPLMDLEGLKAWRPGRTEGYAALERSVNRFGTIDAFVASATASLRGRHT